MPVLALLQEAGAEAAAGDVWGPKVWGLPMFVWHAINLLILIAGGWWLLRKPLANAVKARREGIARSIEDSARLRDEMRAKFEEYDARMKNIDARMGDLVGDAKREAELERARTVDEAKKLASRIRDDAKIVADQEIARAKRELQDEQIALAADLAEKLLQTSVTKDDQSRLATEFLGKLEGGDGAAARKEKPA